MQVDHDASSADLSIASLRLVEIFEEYTNKLHLGEDPSIGDFQRLYPELAERIGGVLLGVNAVTDVYGCSRSMPKELAGCRILREVGRGAAGTVYEAMHPRVTRRLAIKVLDRANKKRLVRFAREAEVLSSLVHPNIVPFLDHGEENGLTYLSMHYIDGASLAHVLRLSRSPDELLTDALPDSAQEFARSVVGEDFRRIAQLGADVASALFYAHSRGVVHRDIKPGNLLLDQQGKVWISDFGLAKAKLEAEDELNQHIVGTPRYMAPEQQVGECSLQSDIYSLGITLYELASGTKAWDWISEEDLLEVRSSIDLPPISVIAPNVPPALARVIMKACASDPEDRYPDAAELQNVLQRFADTGKKADRRVRRRNNNQKYLRRRPVWVVGIVLTTMMLVGFGWRAYRSRVPGDPVSMAEVAGSREFAEAIQQLIPVDESHDTAEAKALRADLAMAVRGMIESLSPPSSHDREEWGALMNQATSRFVDGKFTLAELESVSETRNNVRSFLAARLSQLETDIWRSPASYEERSNAAEVLQGLCHECERGLIDPLVAEKLEQLPKSDLGQWKALPDPFAYMTEIRGIVSNSSQETDEVRGEVNDTPE